MTDTSRHRRPIIPPCDGCGEWDAGSFGFGPPLYPAERHYCGDCTPSRTGVRGLKAPARSAEQGQGRLFG